MSRPARGCRPGRLPAEAASAPVTTHHRLVATWISRNARNAGRSSGIGRPATAITDPAIGHTQDETIFSIRRISAGASPGLHRGAVACTIAEKRPSASVCSG